MFALMTLSEIYRLYLRSLQTIHEAGEAAQITAIIFEYFTGNTKSDVIKEPEKILAPPIIEKLQKSLSSLLADTPVQYITGEARFNNLKLKVSSAVLIPRPETEELVSIVSGFIKSEKQSILDIGTGSGCIAIALKKSHPENTITAVDVSKEALLIAEGNANMHDCNINFKQLDFLDKTTWQQLGIYDHIVSNPPYINYDEKACMPLNVTAYEPHLALFEPAGTHYIFYKLIAEFAKNQLQKDGVICVEIHEANATDIATIFKRNGYETIITKDMFGKDRILAATKKKGLFTARNSG